MYEAIEHYKVYKQIKKEKNKLKGLKYLELAMAKIEFDEFLNKLIAKNGTTNY
tara:strand:+ start:149 stop:307 length:159 start_codon:yes stop_codon:yes gene_type:complete